MSYGPIIYYKPLARILNNYSFIYPDLGTITIPAPPIIHAGKSRDPISPSHSIKLTFNVIHFHPNDNSIYTRNQKSFTNSTIRFALYNHIYNDLGNMLFLHMANVSLDLEAKIIIWS